MLFLLAGGALFLLGTILLYGASLARGRLDVFLKAPPEPPGELFSQPTPEGTLAGVRGKVEARHPLASPLTRQPCVFFSSRLRERIEEVSYRENRRTSLMERQVRIVHHVTEERTDRVWFDVGDGTGTLAVDPSGADIEGVRSVDRFQPSAVTVPPLPLPPLQGERPASTPPDVAPGPLAGPPPEPADAGRRILGVHQTESLLPVGQDVYVLGWLRRSDGRPVLARGPHQDSPFLITIRTWEDLTRSASRSWNFLRIAGAGSCVAGFLLFLWGFR